MQADSAVLELRKDAVVLGTYESAAFILSLRDREEFSTTTSFGYHRIPHIGQAPADCSGSMSTSLCTGTHSHSVWGIWEL